MATSTPTIPPAWNASAAYAPLRASARNVAGLDQARALIRKAREISHRRCMEVARVEQEQMEQIAAREEEVAAQEIVYAEQS